MTIFHYKPFGESPGLIWLGESGNGNTLSVGITVPRLAVWDGLAGSIRRELLKAIVIGLALLGFSGLVNRGPGGAPTGFPLVYTRPIPGCPSQNLIPGKGCRYSYDLPLVGLDFLFWLAIAFGAVSMFSKIKGQWARSRGPAPIQPAPTLNE